MRYSIDRENNVFYHMGEQLIVSYQQTVLNK